MRELLESYEVVLKGGADITIGNSQLSIGTVNRGSLGSYYQVHCEYTPCKFSQLYKRSQLDDAIDKFLTLRKNIDNDKRKKAELAKAKERDKSVPKLQSVR